MNSIERLPNDMTDKKNVSVSIAEVAFQTILAFLAVLVGYPNMTSVTIMLMAPLVVLMVSRMNALFIPALMIHCSSESSIMFVVFVAMMITCIIKSKSFSKQRTVKIIFRMLLLLAPLFIWLTLQKILFDLFNWQGAMNYTSMYLGSWAFLYCFLISDTFDTKVLKLILWSIAGLYLFSNILHIIHWTKLSNCFMLIVPVYGFYFLLKSKRIIIGVLLLIYGIPSFLLSQHGTFTLLLTSVYSIAVFVLWNKHNKYATKITGMSSYIVIFFLMAYGILNYKTAQYGDYAEHMDFSSAQSFINRAQYKFFGDRALFWDAGWRQLLDLKPVLPMYDIPDIIAVSAEGRASEVDFGAHNTPLQLLRIFGFIMGGCLVLCYMAITSMTAKYFQNYNVSGMEVPIVSVAVTNSIILFLTGTAALLPGLALFTFGLMGIASGKICR